MIPRRTMELAAGVLIAGKYRLERPLAAGGMGAVWVARHAQLDVPLALKFMDAAHAASAVSRARFEREAKASASLRNQHVVHVQDYGVEDGTPYLAMELLVGEDLRRRLHRERRLPLAVASRILSQAARGLRTAHEAGVVHRDLKPANIFLARDGDDEEVVKLLDFGIAKETLNAAIGESTRTGELMGSPHYMSPEQVRAARDIDARSDLWSLSVILFRALTGELPFNGDNIGAVIGAILADPIPVPSRLAPDLPLGIDAFFERGFSRNRDQRFQTAREMAEAFAALVAVSGASAEAARWSLSDEPPTRLRMPSNYAIEVASDLHAPPSPMNEDLPSMPTDVMASEALLAGLMQGPASTALGGGTGGPVIHTTPPPAPPLSAGARWLPAAGAVAGVVLGLTAFFALRTPRGATPGAGADTGAPLAASESASPTASAASRGSAEAAVPTAMPGTQPTEAPTVAEAPSARPTAQPTASSKPAARPSATPAARPPAATKRPNWGF
jgi:serine/threonine-protein kinase